LADEQPVLFAQRRGPDVSVPRGAFLTSDFCRPAGVIDVVGGWATTLTMASRRFTRLVVDEADVPWPKLQA
jgi:hypothetical protein